MKKYLTITKFVENEKICQRFSNWDWDLDLASDSRRSLRDFNAAGRGKRNNYFSAPHGNIRNIKRAKKKCVENEKKTENIRMQL